MDLVNCGQATRTCARYPLAFAATCHVAGHHLDTPDLTGSPSRDDQDRKLQGGILAYQLHPQDYLVDFSSRIDFARAIT